MSSLRWLEKDTHISNQSKIRGYVVKPQKEWTQEASVTGALVQREHRDSSKNGIKVACTFPSLSRQATVVLLEKCGNRCINVQDFEGLQGHSGIIDQQAGGKCTTQYSESRGVGQCSGTQPQTSKGGTNLNIIWPQQNTVHAS